jgi:hypothetical protein
MRLFMHHVRVFATGSNSPRQHGEKWLFPKRRLPEKPVSNLLSGAWRLENRYSEQKTGFMCVCFI